MTDVVFFLKSMPPKGADGFDWPEETKLISVDPPSGCMCAGTDPRCSTAYSCLWQSNRDASGRALPSFLRRYAGHVPNIDRVAFVGFSAAHGFLNPLLNNDADRRDVSAVILMDASFGGGKTGYEKAVEAAAKGEMLLVATTSHTGGDKSFLPVWEAAIGRGQYGLPSEVSARPPMPQPSGGVQNLDDAWYYRFVNAQGGSELPHWEMHKILGPVLQAHLIPYWRGWGGRSMGALIGAAIAGIGIYGAWRIYKNGRRHR